MAKNIKKLFALILSVSLVMTYSVNAFATSQKITTDKTAEWVDKDDPTYADVTLNVSGDIEAMGTDIVFIMGSGPAGTPKVLEYLKTTIREILEEFGDTGATVKLGLVCFSETNEIVLDLTQMREEDMDDVIETALNAYEGAYSGINMESALLTAKAMLDADKSVPAERKHMILISTGLTYFFDNDEGKSSTIVGTDTRDAAADDGNGSEDRYVWGNKYWLMARKGFTSTGYGYPIPFNWSWDKYWENILTWVKNDGDAYVYTPKSYLDFVSTADGYNNNLEYQPIINEKVNKNYRYGYVITDPADKAAAAEVAVPYFKGGSNPETTPNAAHALNYERAWYESWKVFTAMQNAGYNCYSIANGGPQSNPTLWLEADQAGRNFMNMLAGGTAPVYSETENFFAPIHKSILYSVGSGSYVEDYVGYDADEGYDFDFVTDANTITLTVGGTTYTTTALENAKDGCDYSYIFTAPGAETAAFTLDYVYGNGTTEEKFTWYFYESVTNSAPVSLSYQVKLGNKQTAAGEYTVYTNQSATLYPADGEAEDFPKPELKYEVKSNETPDPGDTPDPGTNPDEPGDTPDPGTTPGEETEDKQDPATTPGEETEDKQDPVTTPGEETEDKQDPVTTPGEETEDKQDPGTTPGEETEDKQDPVTTPGEETDETQDPGTTPEKENGGTPVPVTSTGNENTNPSSNNGTKSLAEQTAAGELPDTASTFYNLMGAGFLLLAGGAALYKKVKKEKN